MASNRASRRKQTKHASAKVERAAPGPRKRRRSAESKKRALLVETAVSLFMRYGVSRVSVGEVCEQADVSKFTFYKYFTDKIDLAKAAISLLSDRVSARIDEIVAMPVPLANKVALLVDERVRRAREWSPELIHDLYHADPELAALATRRVQENRDRYVAFVRSAQATGEMRPDVHPEVLLAMIDRLYELGKDDELVQRAGGYERLTRSVNNVMYYGLLSRD